VPADETVTYRVGGKTDPGRLGSAIVAAIDQGQRVDLAAIGWAAEEQARAGWQNAHATLAERGITLNMERLPRLEHLTERGAERDITVVHLLLSVAP
jgi:stage V sporulation protein SpoVS